MVWIWVLLAVVVFLYLGLWLLRQHQEIRELNHELAEEMVINVRLHEQIEQLRKTKEASNG